jgi:hypothetical protein
MRLAPLALIACGGGTSDPACDDELPLLADTYFDGTTVRGNAGDLLVGEGKSALLRFRLGPDLVVGDLDFSLVLTQPAAAEECGAGCGACPPMASTRSVTASLVRSDWNETEATAELRDDASPWSMPGPTGVDVVTLPATSATSNGTTLTINFSSGSLSIPPSWPAEEVSVLIRPINTTQPVVRFSSRSNACEPASVPRLTAVCR